jgi:hypothetical protein
MRAIGCGPSTLNRRLCRWCLRAVLKHPGDAEVEILRGKGQSVDAWVATAA